MAKREVMFCDVQNNDCSGDVSSFIVHESGSRQAVAVDLCAVHAQPLRDLLSRGNFTELPTKPRARMEPTKLRTTPRTAPLKKGD